MAALFPSYVITVLELFRKHGFEAYVVGGAVRDLLCGKHPHDYDIVTSARPEETRRLCKGAGLSVVENLGENFGVLILLVEGRAVEVAAYRKEVYGTDAHRPSGVAYCQTLEEDLARRDFTVNAMAMDLAGNLTDPYSGQRDLEHHVLRVVGSPSDRFSEDALRMFRACRFVAQLGFLPEAGILPAIKSEAPRAKGLSLSRVKAELHKLLRAPYAGQGMNLMVQSGLAGMSCRIKKEGTYESVPILPELLDLVGVPQNPRFHPFDVWGHIWHALDHSDGSLTLTRQGGKSHGGKHSRPSGGKRSPSEPCGFSCRKPYAFWTCSIPAGCGTLALASEGSPQRGVPLYQGLAGSIPGIGDPLPCRYGSHNGFGRKSGAGAPFCRSAFSDGRYYARPYSRPCHKRAGPYCCGNSARGP